MAVREILVYPQNEDALRKQSEPVRKIDRYVKHLINDLKDTLNIHHEGIGLAAPQLGVHQRVVNVCLGEDIEGEWHAGPPVALVNPQIMEAEDERKDFDGCLSFPGLYGETVRPHYLRVIGLDENGRSLDQVFEGFNAVLVHHEIDHLDGVLFIDRIEKIEDLYRVSIDEDGRVIRVPIPIYWNTKQEKRRMPSK
ncbi:MAG: peptide deformylase [Anaerolineales bacterium]|jgi:peptide deformylase